jgi:Antitoxin-like ribbon-helix-helix
MGRRPPLTEAGITRPSQALAPPPTRPSEAKRSPARQGKKAVAFWVDPAASAQLRIASINLDRSVQDIMTEALSDWFAKHRLPRLSNGEAA